MSLPIQEKISLVIQCLQEGDISYMDISGSFKVDLDNGISVYLYSDIRANSFTARFETTQIDADKRRADIETIHAELNRVITVAEVYPFQEGEPYGKRFVYTADLDFDGVLLPGQKGEVRDDVSDLNKSPPKALTLDQKNRVIIESLESYNIHFLDVSGSLNVDINAGLSVYIYSEISTDSIVARFESTITDPDMRLLDAETVRVALNIIVDRAVVSKFQEADPCGKRFVYLATLYFEGDTEYDAVRDALDGLPMETDTPPEAADGQADMPASPKTHPEAPPETIELTLENKHRILKDGFKARNIPFLDMDGSFKVYLDSDLSVYIYTEINDNSIHTRFETKETDPGSRLKLIEILKEKFKKAVYGIDIDSFREAAPCGKKFVYTARLEFLATAVQQTPPDADDGSPEPDAAKTGAVDSPLVGKAVELLENMDAKMLREALDSMYLRRSSKVRVAINRFFRGVCSGEELIPLIKSETGRIVSEEDIEELQMIKTTHGDGIFKPLIDLLYQEIFQGPQKTGE